MKDSIKVKYTANLVRIVLIFLEVISLITKGKGSFFLVEILIAVLMLEALGLREKLKGRSRNYAIMASVAVIAMAIYSLSGNMFGGTYFFFATVEGFYLEKRNKRIYLSASIVAYLIFSIGNSLPFNGVENFINSFFNNFIIYIVFISIAFAVVTKRRSREELDKLNRELIEKNRKLEEYAKNIESLTIEKERNRVAQELHDSLGHYLMAISMNVNMIERLEEEKRSEVVVKTKEIVKESIEELRKTVYRFKEKEKFDFIKEINILEDNLPEIKFENNIDLSIDREEDRIKKDIYTTVKECITNGVKHGEARFFKINIGMEEEKILISIFNNGKAKGEIRKSNGLKGIEARFKRNGGDVEFIITREGFKVKGFFLNVKI